MSHPAYHICRTLPNVGATHEWIESRWIHIVTILYSWLICTQSVGYAVWIDVRIDNDLISSCFDEWPRIDSIVDSHLVVLLSQSIIHLSSRSNRFYRHVDWLTIIVDTIINFEKVIRFIDQTFHLLPIHVSSVTNRIWCSCFQVHS
jgi:hypothetical protein